MADLEIKVTHSFQNFFKEAIDLQEDYHVEIKKVEKLPELHGKIQMKNQDFCAYKDKNDYQYRIYHNHDQNNHPYALTCYDLDKKRIEVKYLPEGEPFFKESGNSFFHIGWEKILIQERRMVLHASCVKTKLGGILFSGASGVGKSTQAAMWCKWENATLINGDRTILCKNENLWTAYGSPYAGSSRCYVNDNCNIRAIIFLEKSTENSIRRLKGMEVFQKIYSNITVNNWDKEYVNRVCDLIMIMINDVPIYELKCLPDKSAVDVLKRELEEKHEK